MGRVVHPCRLAPIAVSLCCVLVTASCAENENDAEDKPSTELFVESALDDFEGPGYGWETPLATQSECFDAGRRGPEAREAFCRSLPDPPRGSCWSKVHSRIAWDIWCAITFSP